MNGEPLWLEPMKPLALCLRASDGTLTVIKEWMPPQPVGEQPNLTLIYAHSINCRSDELLRVIVGTER